MTRVSLWSTIVAVAILGWPGGAVAKQIFLSPGEGEDLTAAVQGASEGDKIVLRGEHSGVALGGRAVARYPVGNTLAINKNLTIQGEPGFLPITIEIAGEEGETGNCSDALKNGFLDEGEGEPSWTQFPANKVIVPETQVDLTPEGEGEGETAFAALSDPNVAQFKENNATERATAISQAIGAPGAPAAVPFIYELRYLFPIYPIVVNPDGSVTVPNLPPWDALLTFKLQIQNGGPNDKLEVISSRLGGVVATFNGDNAAFASYAEVAPIQMLDRFNKPEWSYLTFRATVQDSDTRFYVDDVRVGGQPVLDGGFEPGVLQALWTQNSASDPILVQENPAEGQWSARFGQDPDVATALGARQFLHFYYRVDRIKTGDFLDVRINGASLGDPVHLEAAPASAVWRSVSRDVTAEAAAGVALKFVTTGSGVGTFSIDNVYIGPVGTNLAPPANRLQNWDFETWPQTQWVSEPAGREAIIFSPAETGGYWPSHGFARLGGGQDLAFRDISLIEQSVDIPNNVRYVDFYLSIANPDPARVSQFEVWLSDIGRLLAVAHDETPGFGQWQRVRVNLMAYRGETHTLRFVGRVYSGSGSMFFVDNVCMPQEEFTKPVIEITDNKQLTLWNLSVFGGTTSVLVTDGSLTLRRCGVYDATDYGVLFANRGSGTLANSSIAYNGKNGVFAAAGAGQVTILECTLFKNSNAAIFAEGTAVDSYGCLIDQNGSTFAVLGGTIESHQDWVPGGSASPNYGGASGATVVDPLVGEGEGEALDAVPPYCNGCNEPYWPGNLNDRSPWRASTLERTDELAERDFENDPRAMAAVRPGADDPVLVGAGNESGCAVDADYVGRGGQIYITVFTEYADTGVLPDFADSAETVVYVVPELGYDTFNRFDPEPGTYILLSEPDSISPDGDILFQFTVPFDQGDSRNGMWLDLDGDPTTPPVCWEGRAHVYVKYSGDPMEEGCTFVIDTISPILVETENDKDGRLLVTDHNDTCAPNMPLMPGWRPGLELMPYTNGTWATALASATSGPQVFFNVNSQSAYVACAEGEVDLSFQTELSFYDPYPIGVDANGDPIDIEVEVSGFNECGIDPEDPCTSDYEPGLPVWAEGVPASEVVELVSLLDLTGDYPAVTGTWTVTNAPFDASSWFPRAARFLAEDRAGNASDTTPPLMLWWMQDAVISVSGPGDPKDPVFTWRFVRPANPENATPCEPIFRYAVVPVEADGTSPAIDRNSLLWSEWLSTANSGYRITRTAPYQGTTTFADVVEDYQDQGSHLILFVQAADEAGNISEPTSVELVTEAGVVEGELYWPMPVGSGYKLTTRVSARFWHNDPELVQNCSLYTVDPDLAPDRTREIDREVDLGNAVRIPAPNKATRLRIEGQFTITAGYPDSLNSAGIGIRWELWRAGVKIEEDNAIPATNCTLANIVTLPANLLSSDLFCQAHGQDEKDASEQRTSSGLLLTGDVPCEFKAFATYNYDGLILEDDKGASVRFTVVSGRPVLDTQPIKLIVKGE